MTEDEFDDYMEYLISVDAVTVQGYADDGQPMYKFNLDVLEHVAPDMYKVFLEDLDSELMELYKHGLVDIEYDENLNARFKISEKGKLYAETGIMPENDVE
jgi:hypothetical protein